MTLIARPHALALAALVLAPAARAELIGCPPTIGAYRLQTSAADGTISATPTEIAAASCDYRTAPGSAPVRVRAFWIDPRDRRVPEDPRLKCQEVAAAAAAAPCVGPNCPPAVRWQTIVSDTRRAYVEWTAGSAFDEPARLALYEMLQNRVAPRAPECAAGERQGIRVAQAQGAGTPQRNPGIPGETRAAPGPSAPSSMSQPTPGSMGSRPFEIGPALLQPVDVTVRDMPSGPLPNGQGWLKNDGLTFSVQSAPDLNTWWSIAREPILRGRVSGTIRVVEARDARNAGLVLSARDRLDAIAEGDVYVGLGQDGRNVEVHRRSASGWVLLGSVASKGAAGDRINLSRIGDVYDIDVNGAPLRAPAGAGRAVHVFFLVEKGVRADLFAWRVERLP